MQLNRLERSDVTQNAAQTHLPFIIPVDGTPKIRTPAYAALAQASMKPVLPLDTRWNQLAAGDRQKIQTPGHVLNALARSPNKTIAAKELLIRTGIISPSWQACKQAAEEVRDYIDANPKAGFSLTQNANCELTFRYTPE
jgi:hypothetical protein